MGVKAGQRASRAFRTESGRRRTRLEGYFEAKIGKDVKEIMSKVIESLCNRKIKVSFLIDLGGHGGGGERW